MDAFLITSPLAHQLLRGIDAVTRIRVETARPRGRTRRRHLDQVVAAARAAMASGETGAMKAALSSLDLLSFELCND